MQILLIFILIFLLKVDKICSGDDYKNTIDRGGIIQLIYGVKFVVVAQYFLEKFTKCYDELGCIQADEQWFHDTYRPINMIPFDPVTIRTEFLNINKNHTQDNAVCYTLLTPDQPSLEHTGFKDSCLYFILIHDFTSNGYTGWTKHVAKELFAKNDEKCRKIISVNWQHGATPPYDQAIANARIVALEIIKMLNYLKNKSYLCLAKTHLIGHGVGAHIAGYVGAEIKGLRKITALDPSGIRFEYMPPAVRLDKTDAIYVEVLHTDTKESNRQGSDFHFGHSDFYFNGGELQPGCPEGEVTVDLLSVSRNTVDEGQILHGCNHKRAFKYFIESLDDNKCQFLGIKCPNYEQFKMGRCTSCAGGSCIKFGTSMYKYHKNGSYYLQTSDQPPFCLYQYKVVLNIPGQSNYYLGKFNIIIIDVNHHCVISSPLLENRYFTSGKNSVVLYARGPEIRQIKLVKLGWTARENFICLFNCKPHVNVDKIFIETINVNKPSIHQPYLCPSHEITEIQDGDYQTFYPCKSDEKKSKNNKF